MRYLTALLAATLPLLATGQAQLLPAGEFASRDGRPGPGKTWRVTDEQGLAIAAQLNAVAALTPVVIDFEHQTLHSATNGKPAPAAGWIKSAAWRPGEGLFADVDWTPDAKADIAALRYRYISPVITFDKDTGAVQSVAMAALTNFPALLGMDAVVAQLNTQLTHQEPHMTLLASLIAALGLPATTNETDAVAAVAALKTSVAALQAKPPVPAALTAALGLAATADEAAALSAVNALKTPDNGQVQLVASLQGQLATLTAQVNGDKVKAAVEQAIDAHKLLPAQREQYMELGKKDFAMLTAILAAAPVIPGLAGQTGQQSSQQQRDEGGAGSGVAALTATQKLIATQLGLSPEAYAKQLQAAA